MSDVAATAAATFAAGLLMGALYFEGLRRTTRLVLGARSGGAAGALLAISFALRLLLLCGGLVWIGDGSALRVSACGLGVIAARYVLLALGVRTHTESAP